MDGVTAFVDAIYDCYHKLIRIIEEDQKLPSKEILEDVCQVLLNVSCMREEGRFPSFRVCFVQPESGRSLPETECPGSPTFWSAARENCGHASEKRLL